MIEVVLAHDPLWATEFAHEAAAIEAAWPGNLIALHHIGSTSVPGLAAKPIIDMLAVAASLDDADRAATVLTALGYEAMGSFGIDGRRYFRKASKDGVRTHHLHSFAIGSAHVVRHLAFRDYLRATPARAADYGALKQAIAGGASPGLEYWEAKDHLVKAIEAEALAWSVRRDHVTSGPSHSAAEP